MSRSFKHSPCWSPVCYFSNKKSKRAANRALRAANKAILRRHGTRQVLDTWEVPNTWEETSDPYDFDRDWWWFYSVEDLSPSDFKTLREVSDTWSFDSDGLAYWHGIPQWSRPRYWMADAYTSYEDYMAAVRDRQAVTPLYGLNPCPMFRHYWAKFCHYRWKMK